MPEGYDFCGWATHNDVTCSDGLVIRKDAFKDNDGMKVPLVWNHQHTEPFNVLGHAILENRDEGVYAYGYLNDTESGNTTRKMLRNGDIDSMSIYANKLKKNGRDVMHGVIREVSLVLAGANPGAKIEAVLVHSEDGATDDDDELVVATYSSLELKHAESEKKDEEEKPEEAEKETKEEAAEGEKATENKEDDEKKDEEELSPEEREAIQKMKDSKKPPLVHSEESESHSESENEELSHANESKEGTQVADKSSSEKTIKDVFDAMTEEQKSVVYALIGAALEDAKKGEGESTVKQNAFENDTQAQNDEVLSHAEMMEIMADAKKMGSLKDAVLAHGITNIDYLFPDAKSLNTPPAFIDRPQEWVKVVMSGTAHTPFSRVKSMFADITGDEARARGYVKGNQKLEEVFTLLKRETTPQTVYKKQSLDRDDVIDITDFDVVAWLKTEMRGKLDEELARAILVGDGRSASSPDKIGEDHIRPIWTDSSLFVISAVVDVDANDPDKTTKNMIKAAVKARKDYKGSGNPTLFCSESVLTDGLLLEDSIGRRLYGTEAELGSAMRVNKIVSTPIMENLTRTDNQGNVHTLLGIIVNLKDYNVGADKGGAVNMFDDFDIDYNKQKYLIETRCSGALVVPYSAIILETVTAGTEG